MPLTLVVMVVRGLIANHYFVVCLLGGHIWYLCVQWLFWVFVMAICKFNELQCVGKGEEYWCLIIVTCS